jgi:O-antigen ligase
MTESHEGTLDKSSMDRFYYMEEGEKLFDTSSNPIIGSGFATIRYLGIASHSNPNMSAVDPHNGYLHVILEQGIIGFLILLLLFFLSLNAGWNLYKCANEQFFKALGLGLMVCVISIMVNNIVSNNWSHLIVTSLYWAFLGIVIKLSLNRTD